MWSRATSAVATIACAADMDSGSLFSDVALGGTGLEENRLQRSKKLGIRGERAASAGGTASEAADSRAGLAGDKHPRHPVPGVHTSLVECVNASGRDIA